MSSRLSTILLIGATSGIGEALTRRFHGMGKKVIATGRNKDKLDALAAELRGLETRAFDMSELAALPSTVAQVLQDFPELDTVYISAGIQKSYNLFDPLTTASAEKIVHEITTNLTAPNILTQLFAPHLLKLAKSGKKSTIFITSSSLAYIPLGFYPTYCATKAGVHAFMMAFRQQLSSADEEASKNMNIVEVVPPYVDTALDQEHRESIFAMQGGKEKGFQPIPLNEFVNVFFESLDQLTPDGSIKKEIGVGYGQNVADLWRGAFEKVYQQMGVSV
ncbi:NAD(P)-binding protein [Xylaria sp. FL1777]|nr:NAD(P)-binding protein [Xylaria sp. FL1777]